MTSEELSKAASNSVAISPETTAAVISTKTMPAVISSEAPVCVCVSCLVCGEDVPVYGSHGPKICNECKRAILAMRETMKS